MAAGFEPPSSVSKNARESLSDSGAPAAGGEGSWTRKSNQSASVPPRGSGVKTISGAFASSRTARIRAFAPGNRSMTLIAMLSPWGC